MSRSIALLALLSTCALASAAAQGQSSGVSRASDGGNGIQRSVDSGNTSGSQTIRLSGNEARFTVGEIPAENLSQLLSGRFAGLQVVSNGATGTGSRIRIRGQSSLFLCNDPLIVIDGVRLSPSLVSTNVAIPSRVDDINIEDIESIEILGGPSAATLYGTGAANGVVNITTRRGTVGRARMRVYTENGLISDPHDYPDLWSLWGKRSPTSPSTLCTLSLVAAGTCAVDSLSRGNVMNIDSLTPIDIGYRSQYGVQLSGGAHRLQFFIAGEREDETGVYRMPERDVRMLEAERGVTSLPGSQTRPSALARNSVRANVSIQPWSLLSLQLSSAYVSGDVRLVTNEEQSTGLGYNATGGTWRLDVRSSAGVPLVGYAQNTAGDIMSQTNRQSVDHYLNSLSARFSPARWFEAHAQGALDNVLQLDKSFSKRNEGPLSGIGRIGFVTQKRTELSQATADVGVSATFTAAGWLQTKTSFGWQRTHAQNSQETASASDLPAGATMVRDGAVSAGSTNEAKNRVTGYYAEEVLSVRDRFFLTGALRRDTPTLLAYKLDAVNYPAIGISWLLFKRDDSAKQRWFDAVRLRTSYGTSGRVPTVTDGFGALILRGDPSSNNSAFKPKPETVAEFEGGIDITGFDNHSNIALSAYTSTTRDAFILRNFAPSLGGAYSGYENTGRIKNDGAEVTLDQQLVGTPQFSVSILVAASANRNRLTMLPAGVTSIVSGDRSTELNKVGYPLFGLWSRTYTYADANNNGIITANELTVSDTAQFIASSFPTRALALSPTIEFLNHKLRVAAQIDSKWGFKKFNNTLRYQCASVSSCRGLNDRTASLQMQAAAVAATQGILGGMYEDGSFTRIREASVVYELPTRWASALRATAWNVVLTGRNLGVNTNYTGADPESSVSTTDARQDEYFSTPPMRTFTLRFNFSF